MFKYITYIKGNTKLKNKKTKDQKVQELFEKLAGDKVYKVTQRALELEAEGKSPNRAKADALEEFKCIKKESLYED